MEKSIDLTLTKRLSRIAFALAVFTIAYNIAEGLISTFFGYEDESLTLFGFGLDSFIEVVSGIGILIMLVRIRQNAGSAINKYEKTALHITGFSFYLLSLGLVLSSIISIYQNHKPETTVAGVIISIVSIIIMIWLYKSKINVGKKLNSEPIIADGKCTLVCVYMSIILLVSSLLYKTTGISWIDSLGAMGLAWFSFREGKEAFEKAKGKNCCCTCC